MNQEPLSHDPMETETIVSFDHVGSRIELYASIDSYGLNIIDFDNRQHPASYWRLKRNLHDHVGKPYKIIHTDTIGKFYETIEKIINELDPLYYPYDSIQEKFVQLKAEHRNKGIL